MSLILVRVEAKIIYVRGGLDHNCEEGSRSYISRQAGIPCIRNCMQLVWWVGQHRTTFGIGSDAKKEGLRKRVHAHPGRAGRPTCV